jgi:DNA-directed RNA polymerase subunit RPC12/RpoP
MPDKIRITITTVVEYEFDPAHYEGCKTVQDMARVDLAAAEDDPFLFETMEGANTEIKAEILTTRPRTLKDAGFVPGSYEHLCVNCARRFEAHKHTLVCQPCAEKFLVAEPEVTEVEVVTL